MKKKFLQNMKNIQKILIIVVIALFLIPSNTNALVLPNVLTEAKEILKNNYVNPVSDYVLNAEDINEMMRRLNDPYSDYFTNEEYSEFVNRINNTFYGIGIQIDIVPEGVRVSKVIDHSPA